MLAVDGDDLARAAGTGGGHDRTARDQALLVGQGQPLAVQERGDRRGEPGEPHDRVQHDVGVGVGGELRQGVRIAGTRTGLVGVDPELDPLRLEQLGVAPGGQRHHLVAVAMVPDDFERLRADRTRGAEDDDLAHASGGRAAHQTRPRARTR